MLKDNQNLKDVSAGTALSLVNIPASYPKLNKLITALYMVTDILDKNEPLRNKLRDLGAGIISDIYSSPIQANQKIVEILSFLDITSAVGMISGMNCNILKKEFLELQKSIQEFAKQTNPMWLEEFISSSASDESKSSNNEEKNYQGHPTRIGVQKGGTLMKALSEVKVSDKILGRTVLKSDFDVLKKQRREEIIKIIKEKGDLPAGRQGATITDIRNKAKELPGTSVLASCGEKTLQRELISMVKDNVLNKSGEKRWSKYFLPK
jgi:hypothetical protein